MARFLRLLRDNRGKETCPLGVIGIVFLFTHCSEVVVLDGRNLGTQSL
jgi:hypothetical protein